MADLRTTSIRGMLNVDGAIYISQDVEEPFLVAQKHRIVNNVDYIVNFGSGWGDSTAASVALEIFSGDGSTMLGRLDVCASGRIRNTKSGQYLVEEHQGVLWSGAMFMNASQTATLSENVSAQNNGIVLVWSAYSNNAAANWNWNMIFVPKQWVSSHGGTGVTSHISGSNFSNMACKYVYVHNNKIVGNASNENTGTNNGITYKNNAYVLRYVIGV